MARLRTYWMRLTEAPAYYAGGVYRYGFEKDLFLWAQAIAFKVLITIVPIIILATGILGQILRQGDAFRNVRSYIIEYIPSFEQRALLLDFVERLQSGGNFYTGLGIVALIFAAMTLFTTLRIVIGNVFQEEWHRHRTVLGGYLFDLRMAGQVGLLFLLTFGLSLLIQWLNASGLELYRDWGIDWVWLREGWRYTFRLMGLIVPYILSTAMFFQLFYFIPQPHPPKRSAFLGALITGLLWEVAKYTFTFYAASVGRFDRYNVGGDSGDVFFSLGEAFGLIIAFVFWIYYSGVVLIIGAMIAVLNEKRVRLRRLQREKERLVSAEPAEGDGAETAAALRREKVEPGMAREKGEPSVAREKDEPTVQPPREDILNAEIDSLPHHEREVPATDVDPSDVEVERGSAASESGRPGSVGEGDQRAGDSKRDVSIS